MGSLHAIHMKPFAFHLLGYRVYAFFDLSD